MVLLFADQPRDEPALRVWLRGAVDLAIILGASAISVRHCLSSVSHTVS